MSSDSTAGADPSRARASEPYASAAALTPDRKQSSAPLPDGANLALPANGSHTRVLIIEDDPRSARMLQANLTAAGHATMIACDASQARQRALAELPDLILCDVCLPDTDGIELTRWFRSQESTRSTPILLVTSTDETKILARGLEAGADDFLTKPVNSLELRTRVTSLLRTKFLAEQLRAREEAAVSFGPGVNSELAKAAEIEPQASPDAIAGMAAAANILIVDDNHQDRRLIEAFLGDMQCHMRGAESAKSALAALAEQVPDLVILDLILPGDSGYSVIKQIKSDPRLAQTPILVVSAMSDVDARVQSLELGADDFIVKGFDRVEFEARVKRLLRLKETLDRLNDRCDQALRQAITDSLTGLFTHGFLGETLQRQISCARRYGQPLSLVFADIDDFKSVNDQYGHSGGDQVLKALARCLQECVRHDDTVVRYGGDEFVVLLPHADRLVAEKLAERIRIATESLLIDLVAPARPARVSVTLSVGVSNFPFDSADGESLLQHADEAMYQAKQAGRNKVMLFGNSPQTDPTDRKVLLVDDDEKNLRLLQAYLKPEGYQTITARDGIEAVEFARHHRPDLILLDGMMPRLSGFDACRRLKQESTTCLIPVVLVTALSSREDRLRGIEAGADDFLSKPIDKVQLLARIRALLRTKQTTDLLEDAETVIFALARCVESRDAATGDHVERVSRYAVGLGKYVGLPGPELEGLRRAAVVHDIGKIVVPDTVLLKPGPLTPEERALIERHVEVGYELLRPLRTFSESLPAVRYHHERLDGSGYPFGLRGEQIPLTAQILAIADIYDALTSDRCYRAALSTEQAADILRQEASRGLHDPKLIEHFFESISSEHALSSAGSVALT